MMTLSRIRELRLYNLGDLKQIWWQDSEFHVSLSQYLEILHVQSCGQITSIASSPASFQNLRELRVYGCNQMQYMMTLSVSESMVQLKTLSVESCKMLTEIVADENDGTTDIIFNKLKALKLSNLQSLTSFSPGNYAFTFPCLENVIVHVCPNLRIFCLGNVFAPMLKNVKDSEYSQNSYWEVNLNTTIKHMSKNLLVSFY